MSNRDNSPVKTKPDIRVNPGLPWDSEREFLLNMLEKTQTLANEAQRSWVKEREEMKKHHIEITEALEKRVNSLSEEKKLLGSGVKRLHPGNSTEDTCMELLRELERRDSASENREAALALEIKSLKNQLHMLEASTSQKKDRIHEEKHYLQTKLALAYNDTRKAQTDCEAATRELAACNKALALKAQETEKIRIECEGKPQVFNHKKPEGEALLNSQNVGTHIETRKVLKLLRKKEKASLAQLHSFQQERGHLERFYQERTAATEQEHKKLLKKISELTVNNTQNEEQLNRETKTLKDANAHIVRNTKQHTTALGTDLKDTRCQVQLLQRDLCAKESQHLDSLSAHTKEVSTLTDLLARHHKQDISSFTVIETLKSEVRRFSELLLQRDSQVNNLRELYLNYEHAQRRSITKTISSVQSILEDISKQQKQFIEEETHYTTKLRELDQQATEREKALTEHIAELTLELETLRNEHQNYKPDEWEKQMRKLTGENTQLTQQLEYATNNIINYSASIEALEDIVYSKEEDSGESRVVLSLQIEIQRLNGENKSLIITRDSIEKFYLKEIKELQNSFEQKNEEILQLSCKLDRSRRSKAKKELEDIASWQNRQHTFSKTVKTLETQLKMLSNQAVTRKQLSQHENVLENEELRLLRTEVAQKEEWMESLRAAWVQEKDEKTEEIAQLRKNLTEISLFHSEASRALSEEHQLLCSHRAELLITIESLKTQLGENDNTVARSDEEKMALLEDNYSEILSINREAIESLESKLDAQAQRHQSQLDSCRSGLETERNDLQEVEGILNRHIHAQQEEIEQLLRLLAEGKQQHLKELEALYAQLDFFRQPNATGKVVHDIGKHPVSKLINRIRTILKNTQRSSNSVESIKNLQEINKSDNEAQDKKKLLAKELDEFEAAEQERTLHTQQQRNALSFTLNKLQSALHSLQHSTQIESKNIASDLNIVLKQLKSAQSEKASIKSQRDSLLQSISKRRKQPKSDRRGSVLN